MDSARAHEFHHDLIGTDRAPGRQNLGEFGPLRVAMTIQRFAPIVGGAELQLERLLPFLAKRHVHARVLTRAAKGSCPAVVAGARVHRTPGSGESAGASLAYVTGSLVEILRHRRATDLVHAHGALSPATIGIAAVRLGIPCVVTPLGAGKPGDVARLRQKPGGRRRLELLAAHAHFVALSDEIAAELIEAGVASDRIRVIPNGVDATCFRPPSRQERDTLRSALGLGAGFCAAFVGRLHPVKNLPMLMHAIALTSDVELCVVGDGSQRAELETLARALGIERRVRFVGERDDIEHYLRAADAFVLPSIAEGMSNALAEAMACGLACVASSTAAGVRALFGTDRGITADPADPAEWAATLDKLAADDVARAALGTAAERHVRAHLTLDRTADELTSYYHEIVAR